MREGCAALGVRVEEAAVGAVARFLGLVLEASRVHSLVGPADLRTQVERHVLDSLLFARHCAPGAGEVVVDVGTGAGFPGMVLALVFPHARVWLVEATRKKVDFLLQAIAALGLEARVTAHWGRAEELGKKSLRERAHVGTCRALAALPLDLELLSPLVRVGGRVVVGKGPGVEGAEEEQGRRAARRLGLEAEGRAEYRLPWSGARRILLLYRKVGATPAAYPRRYGEMRRRPLGLEEDGGRWTARR